MTALRVSFVDQAGDTPGGAELTLLSFLKHRPPDIVPHVVTFEDGAFAQSIRELDIPVDVATVPDALKRSTRERLRVGGALQIPSAAVKVATLLSRHGADLVYTNSVKAHLVGGTAALLRRRPCVMHFHDLLEGQALRAVRLAARLGSYERVACSAAVSESVALDRTSVIYAPLELAEYAPPRVPDRESARAALGLPADVPIVTIVGRINRWKGHDRFLRIAARVLGETPAHFVIVGSPVFRDADFLPELVAQARTLGLGDAVTFLPWLDDVRALYAAVDVNCNCSTREPFGRTIVEAAAAGIPTVCFDDSGASETILDRVTGRIVPAGDEAAFAAAIVELLADRHARVALGHAARASAARFDAPAIADDMARVMRRAADR